MYSKKLPQVRPIARGGACNNCKRRKMRCDGQRPVCGPCSRRIESLGDCEYAEVGHTHADRLQEQIAVLEARLEALQNPFSQRDAVTLIDPYVASSSVMSQLHRTSSDSVMVNGSRNPFEESAQERNLMEAFLPHASQLGFFLDAQNLIYAFSNPYSDPSQRPTAALAATMVLLGSKLVPASHIILPTEVYLSNAVQAVSLGLSESHPQRILHTLQANILIAHYFLIHNRGLEGRWHLNNAVSLILSARMHRIRSSHIYDNTQALSIDTTTTLPPARNFPEEGERINAIWTVLALDCLWSAVEGKPTFTAYTTGQGRVDTPWPLESYSDVSREFIKPHSHVRISS
ncbi:hypothetical protein GYMLUDRAFT_481274 [Collybiopsis luxurians FD-317 M1]|uniref:Zn(2)-C6 fungal-type domain-containing protein n=1 Tax=Collybiopsis luxurians FD-317 M1 TaxID=944289 RepID=A0A0D0D1Q6_9AGAR|nr:hypothetical protein GYMLUDRAFT_481274 [Collybiopsis luxurians FD-317 M1]